MELEGKGRVRLEKGLTITRRTTSITRTATGGHGRILNVGMKSRDFNSEGRDGIDRTCQCTKADHQGVKDDLVFGLATG